MSTTEYLKAILIPIVGTEDWTSGQILRALIPVVGKPTEGPEYADEYPEDDAWFSYKQEVDGSHWGTIAGFWAPEKFNGRWNLRYVLGHSRDYDESPLAISVGTQVALIVEGSNLLRQASLKPGRGLLVAYSWYNGSDGPDSIGLWEKPGGLGGGSTGT